MYDFIISDCDTIYVQYCYFTIKNLDLTGIVLRSARFATLTQAVTETSGGTGNVCGCDATSPICSVLVLGGRLTCVCLPAGCRRERRPQSSLRHPAGTVQCALAEVTMLTGPFETSSQFH